MWDSLWFGAQIATLVGEDYGAPSPEISLEEATAAAITFRLDLQNVRDRLSDSLRAVNNAQGLYQQRDSDDYGPDAGGGDGARRHGAGTHRIRGSHRRHQGRAALRPGGSRPRPPESCLR